MYQHPEIDSISLTDILETILGACRVGKEYNKLFALYKYFPREGEYTLLFLSQTWVSLSYISEYIPI